ncbi:MAG: hypothetical protein JNM55_13865 [Anaerolineales bacterium]|nr:hypothetical protein [Anaerolineales bacterium]
MKIRSGLLIVLAMLTMSQLRCSADKQGSMVIQAFVDINQSGTPDEGDEMLPGVQMAYDGFGVQSSDTQGTATFVVNQESVETCLYLNEQKPISVLPPPGYVLKDTKIGMWDCEQGWGEADNFAYLHFEKLSAATPLPAATQVPATLTPAPMPMFVETATSPTQPMPALTLEAKTIPPTFSFAGANIKFSYLITNTGNVTLTGPFTLKDLSDISSIYCTQYLQAAVLQPGESMQCGASRKARPPDVNAGVVGNVITISVTYVDPLTNGTFTVSAEAQTGSVYVK